MRCIYMPPPELVSPLLRGATETVFRLPRCGAKSQGARNRISGDVPQKTPWQGARDWEENGHIRQRLILIRPCVIVLYRLDAVLCSLGVDPLSASHSCSGLALPRILENLIQNVLARTARQNFDKIYCGALRRAQRAKTLPDYVP